MTKLRAWRYLSVVMVVALILGVGAMAMPTSPTLAAVPAGDWDIQTVDDGDVFATSLALDSYGYPHISYTTGGLRSLHYARWTGTAWAKEMVDDVPAFATSIALDSNDYPHISYTTLTGQSVHYARWTGTAWVKQTVEECDAWDCSLALDRYGYPRISYTTFGGYDGSLHLAWPSGTTGWDILTLDESPTMATSLALDSSNLPHISYTTFGDLAGSLHYARLVGTGWEIQTVDERPVNSTSIALDSNDCPCISYTTGGIGIGSLHYARLTGAGWDIKTVDGSDNLHSVSLALDSNDYPHISYATGGAPSLHYAHWTGTAWATETVDPRVVGATSLALDSSDYPHISYATAGLFSLHYARLIPPDTDTVNTAMGTATFSTSAGGIAKLTALAPTAIPCAPRSDIEFPQGLFSFNILGLDPGETVIVTITLPSDMPAGIQYWKCINGQWVDCSSLLGDNDGDNVLTLTLTDGGLGDADGVTNGTIIDPGGPATPTPIVTAINPNSGMQRQTLGPIITGTNFTGATAVSFGAGITVTSFAVDSDTQIRTGITIAGNAVPGASDVSVTTIFGTGTLGGGFTVNSPAPSNPNGSPSMTQPSNLFSPAQLSAQYVSVNPQQTYANQPVTITANVVNTGGEAGEFNVALKINGQVEQSRMVSVDPKGIQTVEFTVNKAQPGTYNVDILGKNGSFTILNAGSSTSSSPSENSGSKTGGLILLVSIGILIIVSLVVLLARRT